MAKNPRAEAMQEMAREKARIFRKRTKAPSLLEEAAAAWKKKRDMEERQRLVETAKTQEVPSRSFRDILAKRVVDYDKGKLSGLFPATGVGPEQSRDAGARDATEWTQYSPWQKEGDKEKKKEIPLNTATVVAIRKKLIAQEWARALGKRTTATRLHDLGQEAAVWKQKRDEEKRRKEEMRMRIERHKEVLSNALADFSERLRENKDSLNPEALSGLLAKSLESAGEVFDIEWDQTACVLWLEPWEEKKCRKIYGFDIPVIYRVQIDEDLKIVSYEEVEDEEIIDELREELLTRPLKESLEAVSFNTDSEAQARQFLEDPLSEIGRLISLDRTPTGWLAVIEPWEEMRVRKTKRRGRPPIVTDEIEIDWKDGKLEFVQEEEEENSPQSTVDRPQSRETTDEGLNDKEYDIEEENVEGDNSNSQNQSTVNRPLATMASGL